MTMAEKKMRCFMGEAWTSLANTPMLVDKIIWLQFLNSSMGIAFDNTPFDEQESHYTE